MWLLDRGAPGYLNQMAKWCDALFLEKEARNPRLNGPWIFLDAAC